MKKNKITIIGTGISGLGAYLALTSLKNNFDYTFFNYGETIKTTNNNEKKKFPTISPPSKKEFGFSLNTEFINSKELEIRTPSTSGGLSDFWSGSVFPFTKEELKKRKLLSLEKYYKDVGDLLRIDGNAKNLHYIYQNYIKFNREIKSPMGFDSLNQINKIKNNEYQIKVGSNRIISEDKLNNLCNYCGNCFVGCENNSILRPMNIFSKEKANIKNIKIKKIKYIKNKWCLYDDKNHLVDTSEILFLAGGVTETIRLLVNSNLVSANKIEIYDSNSIIFPIFFNKFKSDYSDIFAYGNKIVATKSDKPELNTHTIITPFSNFFSEHFFGSFFSKHLKGYSLNLLALANFFSSSVECNIYGLDKDNNFILKLNRFGCASKTLKKIISETNSKVYGFKLLDIQVPGKTSSHYSSNLLSNNEDLLKRAQLAKNLFIIDGNLFPGAPESTPQSYSILAGSFGVTSELIKNSN